jgi:hypothetical protein
MVPRVAIAVFGLTNREVDEAGRIAIEQKSLHYKAVQAAFRAMPHGPRRQWVLRPGDGPCSSAGARILEQRQVRNQESFGKNPQHHWRRDAGVLWQKSSSENSTEVCARTFIQSFSIMSEDSGVCEPN